MKILVVDDDDDVRTCAASIFEQLGFEVLHAAHGGDALPLLRDHHDIALLFTDVRMPVMDGPTLAAEARKLRPKLPVIFTSGYIGALPVDNAPLLRKPFRLGELERLLQRTLRRGASARR